MWWAAAISIGLSLFGASKQSKAGDQAENIAALNAAAEAKESAETTRRMFAASRQQVGYAKAVAGASGFSVQPGTSQANYISALERENRRQIDFTFQSSLRKQDILKRGGQLAYSQAQAGAVGTLASGFSSAVALWNT